MKKVYVPFRYIHIIQQIFTKNNKQTIRIKHLFKKIFVQLAQKREGVFFWRSKERKVPGFRFPRPFVVPEDSMLLHLAFRPLHNSAPSLHRPQDALRLDSPQRPRRGVMFLGRGFLLLYCFRFCKFSVFEPPALRQHSVACSPEIARLQRKIMLAISR